MSQILGIKFSDHGPVCYFASGALVVRAGHSVLVETDQGLALGRVVTVAAAESAAQDLPVAEAALAAVPAGDAEPAPFEATLDAAHWDEEPHLVPTPAVEPGETKDAVGDQPQPASGGVYSLEQAAQYQPRPKSVAGLQVVYRMATQSDVETGLENRRLARRAFNFCRGCISQQNLDMKLVDVEVLHDRSKMIFYFTAPNRIDFRELIKCLVREFHTRIELRQIGVRHETQMIGAIGNCGQVCCCRRFLRKFAPVTIKMAKEQNLFLNPAKISGICGRLLCCLSYEQKGYEEFHKQCPKIGKRFQTAIGNVKVLRANFFKKSISVWVEEAGEREYSLDEWKELMTRQVPAEGSTPEGQQADRQEGRPEGRSEGRQPQGRQGGRPSSGRPARPERAPRPERADQPERADRPERVERAERSPERAETRALPAEPREGEPRSGDPRGGDPRGGDPRGGDPRGAENATTDPRAESREGEPGRSRPRRKRRKSRGPKPA